jgi:hypothetical protein
MSCHLCKNSAIGLCRQCFKFYCHVHGNGYCSSCQQKGWEEESDIKVKGFSYAQIYPTTPSGIPLEALAGSTETAQAEEAEKSEAQETSEVTGSGEQDEGIGAREGWMMWMDQEKTEELTEPSKFVSLLPVFGTALANDALMMIKGIELYQEAFNIDLVMHFGSSADNGSMHRHMTPTEVTLHDDVGTDYKLHPRNGGGSNREWTQHYIVASILNPAARQLTLQIPKLEVHEHTFKSHGGSNLPKRSFLNGPWTIRCAIPPRE